MPRMRRRVSLFVSAVLLGFCDVAAAQVTTADVVGRVTDEAGGALPGAMVTLHHDATGLSRSVATSGTGDYVFTLLPIGTYTVQVDLAGFGRFAGAVELSAGDRRRVDVALHVGGLTESVVVSSQATVQSDSSTLGALIPERGVQDLPLNGRNVVGLVRLVPGANEGLPTSLSSGNRPDDRRQTSTVSVNGQNDVVNNNLIDGMDNNERYTGTIGVRPSVDAIAEIKVQTNAYTAETGRTAGAVVNVVTRSGSNDLHGSAYGFLRNERFDARNFFTPASQPKPVLRQEQWGGSVGGAALRDRTFFFGDYEHFHQVQGRTSVSTVPTARMRSGDFSEIAGAIYDPWLQPRPPFADNVIPADRIDPVAARFVGLYPLPTTGALVNNYTATRNRTQESDTFDVRVDHRLTSSLTAYARYSDNRVTTVVPGVFEPVDGIDAGGSAAGFGGPSKSSARGLQVNLQHVATSSLVTELKAGTTSFATRSVTPTQGLDVAAAFGLPGVNVDALTSGLPSFSIAGYTALGDAQFIPLLLDDDTWQVQGTVTSTIRSHTLKVGAGVVRRSFTPFQSNQGTGLFTFTAAPTSNGSGSGGDAIASMLLGYPAQIQRSNLLARTTLQTWEPGVFVQDDWRATTWLTVNMGLRYDVFTPLTESDDEIANLDPSTLRLLLAGKDGVTRSANVRTDIGNLAPRIGGAATLRTGLVLRGGYGMSFWPSQYASDGVLRNTPFTYTYGPVVSAAASGGVPDLLFASGLPVPAMQPPAVAGTIVAVDPDLASSYLHQYNVMLEHEVWGGALVAGYVGSQARRLWMRVPNLNLAPAGPGAVNPRRPYYASAPSLSTLGILRSAGRGGYDALQLSFSRRSHGGLTVAGNYTYAKGTSNVTQPGGGGAPQGYGVVPDRIGTMEMGASDIDIRHRYALAANYELPFGARRFGVLRHVLAGWQVNVIAFWQSGLPFTVVNATPRSNTGVGANGDRPDRLCSGRLRDPSLARWFDTSCFAPQAPDTVGDSGRNILYGPPQRRIDLSIFKHVAIGETRLQVRAECFNVTNTPSFGVPNAALGSATFGTVTTTANAQPRQLQFALKFLF